MWHQYSAHSLLASRAPIRVWAMQWQQSVRRIGRYHWNIYCVACVSADTRGAPLCALLNWKSPSVIRPCCNTHTSSCERSSWPNLWQIVLRSVTVIRFYDRRYEWNQIFVFGQTDLFTSCESCVKRRLWLCVYWLNTSDRSLTLLWPVVTICTNSLTFNNSTFCPHSVFMCFVWIWEQTAIISLYSINWLVCITEI